MQTLRRKLYSRCICSVLTQQWNPFNLDTNEVVESVVLGEKLAFQEYYLVQLLWGSIDYILLLLSPPLPLSPQSLSEVESEDMVQEERARKAAVRKSRMESDLDAENADLQEKKGVSE